MLARTSEVLRPRRSSRDALRVSCDGALHVPSRGDTYPFQLIGGTGNGMPRGGELVLLPEQLQLLARGLERLRPDGAAAPLEGMRGGGEPRRIAAGDGRLH